MDRKGQLLPYKDENPLTRIEWPLVNYAIIVINIIVFVFSLFAFESIITNFGFTPAIAAPLTFLTSMFLHGGIMHLLGNMWFLYIFGDNVEDAFGHIGYLVFYLLAGLAATLSHWALNVGSMIPAIGASGAISGALGAYLILYPDVKVHYFARGMSGTMSAKWLTVMWFGFQLLGAALGFFGSESGIAFFAHIGGFVFGAISAFVWKTTSSAIGDSKNDKKEKK